MQDTTGVIDMIKILIVDDEKPINDLIEMNLTDKPQKRSVKVNDFEKVISNVNTSKADTLSPFEANVYKVK